MILKFCRVSGFLTVLGCFGSSLAIEPPEGVFVKTREGAPFFPLGFYGPHWTKPLQERLDCLKALNEAGLNTVFLEDAGTSSGFPEIVDSASALGLRMIVGTPNPSGITGTVKAYKSRPLILAWSLADDADDGKPLEELKTMHAAIKAEDASRPTYLSLTGWNQSRRDKAAQFMPIADIAGFQIYPITPLTGYDVTAPQALLETYRRTRVYARAASDHGRPLLMNAQAFNWQGRFPTAAEERNMAYAGLAAGAKGLVWYDFSSDLFQKQTGLWEEIKALAADCRRLYPFFLEGGFTVLDSAVGGVAASSWMRNDSLLLVVVNTSYTESASVQLPIPQGMGEWLHGISPRMPQGLQAAGGFLLGTVKPLEVHVYVAGRKSTSNASGKKKHRSMRVRNRDCKDALGRWRANRLKP